MAAPTATAPDSTANTAADTSGDTSQQQQDTSDGLYTLRWIAAWVVFLSVLALLNRTRLGHAALYHLLVLATVLLLAGQYRKFAQLEEPITGVVVQ